MAGKTARERKTEEEGGNKQDPSSPRPKREYISSYPAKKEVSPKET